MSRHTGPIVSIHECEVCGRPNGFQANARCDGTHSICIECGEALTHGVPTPDASRRYFPACPDALTDEERAFCALAGYPLPEASDA